MNISLIGPRGSGKTRVSQRLARYYKWPVFSLDALISYESGGKPIAAIIEDNNGDWRAFRDLEYDVLKKATAMHNVIIDCGGGIVVDLDADGEEVFSERKTALLRNTSLVFFLHPPLEDVAAKIAGDPNRPVLDAGKSAADIYNRRLPWYQQTAHHEVPVRKGQRRGAAEMITELVSRHQT